MQAAYFIIVLQRYSECFDSDVTSQNNGSVFYLVNFSLNVDIGGGNQKVASKLGTCFPKTCDDHDVNIITNNSFNKVNGLLEKYNISAIRYLSAYILPCSMNVILVYLMLELWMLVGANCSS